jgi:hypothetical protein
MKHLSVIILPPLIFAISSNVWGDHLLRKINAEYKLSVKPIFEKSCLNCHGNQTDFPWYYKIPGVKFMINNDIAEAHKTIDMSKDYPFIGKGTPEELLGAISDVIEDKSMPPWRYRIMHRNSMLSEQESDIILKWVQQSKDLISAQ